MTSFWFNDLTVLYKNNSLLEDFNMEYLNDSLWKATRFTIDAKINPTNPIIKNEPIPVKFLFVVYP